MNIYFSQQHLGQNQCNFFGLANAKDTTMIAQCGKGCKREPLKELQRGACFLSFFWTLSNLFSCIFQMNSDKRNMSQLSSWSSGQSRWKPAVNFMSALFLSQHVFTIILLHIKPRGCIKYTLLSTLSYSQQKKPKLYINKNTHTIALKKKQ